MLAAGGTYLALGDRGEALFLLGSVLVVIGITLTQERKTQRALESLRELSAPRALVLRDGVERLERAHGRSYGDSSERLTASLLARAVMTLGPVTAPDATRVAAQPLSALLLPVDEGDA